MHLRLVNFFAVGLCTAVLLGGCAGQRASSPLPLVAPPGTAGLQRVAGFMPDANSSANAVKNGGFDTGRLKPWKSCGTAKVSVSKQHPYNGKYDALTGSATTKKEVKGWSAICQTIEVPQGATLTAQLYRATNEPNMKSSYQEVALANAAGKPTTVLAKANGKSAKWVKQSWSLKKYAGKSVTLFFGVYGSGRKKYYDTQYVDDVQVSGVGSSAKLTVDPTSLTFSSTDTQTFQADETGYSGALTATSSDTSIATVSPGSGKGPSATFTVTPLAGGSCKITVKDANGQQVSVDVSISGGIIVIDRTGREHTLKGVQ